MLMDCDNYSGDVDTVAAIAMGAASWSPEYKKDLDPNLTLLLEQRRNGPCAATFLRELDERLETIALANL